jgi:hypothetical protein
MWALFSLVGIPLILPLVAAWLVFRFFSSLPAGAPERNATAYAVGLVFLGASTFVCMMASFVIAGGPDGRFLKPDTLMYGSAAAVVCFLLALVAVRLLWLRWRIATCFLLPVLATLLACVSAFYVHTPFLVVVGAFGGTPLLCMLGILLLSYLEVRRYAAARKSGTHSEFPHEQNLS